MKEVQPRSVPQENLQYVLVFHLEPRAVEIMEQAMQLHSQGCQEGWWTNPQYFALDGAWGIGGDSMGQELRNLLPSLEGKGLGFTWHVKNPDQLYNIYIARTGSK